MSELIPRPPGPPTSVPMSPSSFEENQSLQTVDARVRFIVEFMESNLEKRMAAGELARLVGLSDSRFRHLFTAETGMSPKTCLRKLRLDRAKLLLDESALTIDQIALRVGWQHRSHFERRFKQFYDMTPAHYRMMRQINLLQKKVR